MKQTKISEYLILEEENGKRTIKCAKCGFEYCSPDENFKLHALMWERAVTEIGRLVRDPKLYLDEDWGFREYCCPGCGTTVETEIARKDDAPRVNVMLK